jgi:hypothetical protein
MESGARRPRSGGHRDAKRPSGRDDYDTKAKTKTKAKTHRLDQTNPTDRPT